MKKSNKIQISVLLNKVSLKQPFSFIYMLFFYGCFDAARQSCILATETFVQPQRLKYVSSHISESFCAWKSTSQLSLKTALAQEAIMKYFRGYRFINTCQNVNFISFLLITNNQKKILRHVPFQYLPKMYFSCIVAQDNEP